MKNNYLGSAVFRTEEECEYACVADSRINDDFSILDLEKKEEKEEPPPAHFFNKASSDSNSTCNQSTYSSSINVGECFSAAEQAMSQFYPAASATSYCSTLVLEPHCLPQQQHPNVIGCGGGEGGVPPPAWLIHHQPQSYSRPPTAAAACLSPSFSSSSSSSFDGSDGCVTTIGMVGVALGVAGMIAYGILQVPTLRRNLYALPDDINEEEHPSYSSGNSSSSNKTEFDIHGEYYSSGDIAYGYELAGVFIGTFIGILVNALLVYGAVSKSSSFLLPWLVFQSLFVTLLILAFILVAVLTEPAKLKALSLVPLSVAALEVFLWIRVQRHFKKLRHRALMKSMEFPLISYSAGASSLERLPNFDGLCYCGGDCCCCRSPHSYPVAASRQSSSDSSDSSSTYQSFSEL